MKKYPKYYKNFERQRKYYYAAESIRQSTRDIFCDDEFDILKSETFDAIIDACEDYYENGFRRLNEVLKHVTKVHLTQSKITKIPGWVNTAEKKGLCHMLINDNEISWVNNYE